MKRYWGAVVIELVSGRRARVRILLGGKVYIQRS